MVKVEILIPNFKDKENKHLGLLQPGYVYEVTKERADFFEKKGYARKYKEPKENKGE